MGLSLSSFCLLFNTCNKTIEPLVAWNWFTAVCKAKHIFIATGGVQMKYDFSVTTIPIEQTPAA